MTAAAHRVCPRPASTPTAEAHHTVAAVLMPRIVAPWWMITPVSWLERVPSYKDQQTKLSDRDLATYGFLGYPVLMSADVLSYRAGNVPVGAGHGEDISRPRPERPY